MGTDGDRGRLHTVCCGEHQRREDLVRRDIMQRRDGVDEVEVVWVVRVTIVGRPSTAWELLRQRP